MKGTRKMINAFPASRFLAMGGAVKCEGMDTTKMPLQRHSVEFGTEDLSPGRSANRPTL